MYAPFGIGVLIGPRRVLAGNGREADGVPPVPYRQDSSTGDFFPAAWAFPERAA